jgi:hypothetical protein
MWSIPLVGFGERVMDTAFKSFFATVKGNAALGGALV